MKIAVTGKGGVGKTTLSAALCRLFADEGKRVLAIDADPDANLASAFGVDKDAISKIRPIAELTDVIQERTGARPGTQGGIFKLNPKVDDIPEGFGFKIGSITLVVIGKSKEAASGCYCPENVFLRRLLKHLVVERDEAVVLDMEAGIEHLTRGTSEAVDAFLVVVEPGQRSIQTAHMVKDMAKTLGVRYVFAVANKVRGDDDLKFIKSHLNDIELAGSLSYSALTTEADIKGVPPYENNPGLLEEVRAVKESIERAIG